MRLSVGIIAKVLLNFPSVIESVTTSQFMCIVSTELVIFGNLVLYSVSVLSMFESN